MLIAARVINGFGAGALFQTMSLYTAEISPANIRGRMTAVLNTGIALGLMVAYWVQYATARLHGAASWRLPLALQLVPAIWVGIHVFLRPETPRWLCSHGRPDEALAVLARLHAAGDTENASVRAELAAIQVAINFEQQLQDKTPSYLQLIVHKRYRRRTALAVGAQFLQQLSGPNIVLYYASKVFAQTGTSGTEATLLANGIGGALLLAATFSLNLLIDFYGRRKPLIIGPFLMGICLVVVGAMLLGFGAPHFDDTTQALTFSFANVSAGHAAIAFMFLYMIFFGCFYSSVPWTYPNEALSLEARARGTALSTAINWFSNLWLGLYIPTALNTAGWKLYFIFGAFCFAISVISFLFSQRPPAAPSRRWSCCSCRPAPPLSFATATPPARGSLLVVPTTMPRATARPLSRISARCWRWSAKRLLPSPRDRGPRERERERERRAVDWKCCVVLRQR